METLNRSPREEQLAAIGTIGFPTLVLAGYLTMAGLAIWGFSRPRSAVAEPTTDSPGLLCQCRSLPAGKRPVHRIALPLGRAPLMHRL